MIWSTSLPCGVLINIGISLERGEGEQHRSNQLLSRREFIDIHQFGKHVLAQVLASFVILDQHAFAKCLARSPNTVRRSTLRAVLPQDVRRTGVDVIFLHPVTQWAVRHAKWIQKCLATSNVDLSGGGTIKLPPAPPSPPLPPSHTHTHTSSCRRTYVRPEARMCFRVRFHVGTTCQLMRSWVIDTHNESQFETHCSPSHRFF